MNNPLVIGYKGEIGSFILAGLLKILPKATNIWCYDINETCEEIDARLQRADVIFLCVPINKTADFFRDWACLLTNKIIIEQTSLKSVLFQHKDVQQIIKKQNITVLSTHILFRPSATPNIQDRTVAIIGNNWGTLESIMADICQCPLVYFDTWRSHDQEMAFQQTLVHRVLLTLDKTLSGTQTYIGKQVHKLAERIKQNDPQLFKIIQQNPHQLKAFHKFHTNLKNFKI